MKIKTMVRAAIRAAYMIGRIDEEIMVLDYPENVRRHLPADVWEEVQHGIAELRARRIRRNRQLTKFYKAVGKRLEMQA